MLRCRWTELSTTMRDHKLWKHTIVLVGPALAEGPLATRSHLYHPGFRHEYRAADPAAQADLRARGAVGVASEHGAGPA
jgi:precorrin-4/cobalt-precorrin-4 C11-methyltransferase